MTADEKTILVLGGYGNVGKAISALLLKETACQVIIAGRHLDKARGLAKGLAKELDASTKRVQARHVEATSPQSLKAGLQGVDLIIVASSAMTTAKAQEMVATAVLDAKVDYIDLHMTDIKSFADDIQSRVASSGQWCIVQGGHHPGVPVALVRYAAKELHNLQKAEIFVFAQSDWNDITLAPETEEEFLRTVNDMENCAFVKGEWKSQAWFMTKEYDFSNGYHKHVCARTLLEELTEIPNAVPTLDHLAMYIGGFNPVTIFIFMPLCKFLSWLSPRRLLQPMARLFLWSLRKFTSPPYGNVIAIEASGIEAEDRLFIRIEHRDGYMFTAIPLVACVLQLLDDGFVSDTRGGLARQATVVEPTRFLQDMERMGISMVIDKIAD